MFHPLARKISLVIAAIVAGALLFGGVLIATTPRAAVGLCDVKSLRTMADDPAYADQASYLRQEANVCEGLNPDGSDPKQVDKDKKESEKREAAKQQKRQVVWLVNAPASTKVSVNSFGPKYALEPSLAGRPLEGLNLDELLVENKFRRQLDPSMTAAMGAFAEVGLWTHDEINAKTRVFAGDFAKWDAANAAIDTKLAALKVAGKLKIVSLPSGMYTATYELVAGDGMPNILKDENVQRSQPFFALQIGEEYGRIECSAGGQQYWPHSAGPKMQSMPSPSPGMTRTEEGTPVKEQPTPSPSTPGTPGTTTSTPTTSTPTTGTPTTGTPTTSVPTTSTPGTPAPKDPSKDGGNRGNVNENQGPGAVTTPTQPPAAPRTNPPVPTAVPTQAPQVTVHPDPVPTTTVAPGTQPPNNGQVPVGPGDPNNPF